MKLWPGWAGGVYGYRTRKPGAWWGLPFIGRHWAYIGETTSFYHRGKQHIEGGGTYQAVRKNWSDLDPKCYCLPLPSWKWLLRSVETLAIVLTWPVYNIQKNRWNPRRIPPWQAAAQRAARDAEGWRGHMLRPLTAIGARHALLLIPLMTITAFWRY